MAASTPGKAPTPFPNSRQNLAAFRKSLPRRTFKFEIEELLNRLVGDEEFRQYREAEYNDQAVEGSLIDDDVKSAEMIRDLARQMGFAYTSNQKLPAIRKKLNEVLKDYQLTRRERR